MYLVIFLTGNGLSSQQHGFRPQHSCQMHLLETFHQWAASLDRKMCAKFLGLTKTFDTVPHQLSWNILVLEVHYYAG